MQEIMISLEQLRGLIGLHVRHRGAVYEVIEVLEDGPSIVLRALGQESVIQGSLFGDATRRVPQTVTVPILSADRSELSSSFLSLDLLQGTSD